MSEIIKGNVVDALLNGDVDWLLHCCNCQNNFGSGIAKEIKERIPSAYQTDKDAWDYTGGDLLGTVSFDQSGVVNVYAQEYYGYFGEWFKQKGRQVDYKALAKALISFLHEFDDLSLEGNLVGLPYKFASDRAGGDWEIVQALVESVLEDAGFEVVWYELER